MKVRLADKNDAEAISVLLTQLTQKYIAIQFSDEGKRNAVRSMSEEAIKGYLGQGFRYHVGEVNGRIIGVAGTRDNSHLFHLFVDDRFQGIGYATQLWRIAKAACIEDGNPGYFTVNSSLNAQEIYKHWGFVPASGVRERGGVKDLPMRMELTSHKQRQ